jgi:hypothetical protein
MVDASLTFFPKSKVAFSGSALDIDNLGYDNEFVASFETFEVVPKVFSAKKDENLEAYQAALNPRIGYRIEEVREELSAMKRIQKKIDKVKANSRGRNQFNASVIGEMQDLQEQYNAVVNGDNTNQLTIVQFVNEIVGKLEQPSYITTAFKHIALDRLRGKIPEMGWPAVTLQVGRLSEPEISNTEFGQLEFRIFRNDIHIYVSREDRMEATIDPYAVSTSQGQIQMLRARELLALKELSTLVYAGDGTYGELPDFTATGTEGVPHATNDGPKAFVNVILSHFNKFFNYVKYFIWNPLDYRDYLSNWFSFAYAQIEAPQGFGVVPMRGLEQYNAVAIISPYVPQGFVYSLTDEGAYELDGPYVVDAEYDAKKFADYNIVHDFIGYAIMHPERFGEKLKITASPSGTEITTDLQVYNLLKPPTGIVVKNATA